MRKIKFPGTLSLVKKTITKLSDDQLDNVQGGMAGLSPKSKTSSACSSGSCQTCINCEIRAAL